MAILHREIIQTKKGRATLNRTPTAVGTADHDNCIVDLAAELFDRGYSVYLEFRFYLEEGTNMNGKRLIVDIYATKGTEELIIEVGSLSPTHTLCLNVREERFRLLKKLCPTAKIVHVTQWKNWLTNDEFWEAWIDERYRKDRKVNMAKALSVDEYLAKGLQFVSDEEMTKMGRSLVKNQQGR